MGTKYSKLDLFWIVPKLIGELFFTVYIPFALVVKLFYVDIFSTDGLVYSGVGFMLIMNMRLTGLYDIARIRWKKKGGRRDAI